MTQANILDPLPSLYIGIDGGGSKCKAKLVSDDAKFVGVGISGRANPVHGMETTLESIVDSAHKALADADLPRRALRNVIAGIGLAGVNLPSLFEQVNNWPHPFKEMHLTTDLHIACLGAHAWQDGSVIISGTGSCGISMIDGKTKMYGAHGFPLGDQGSGAWLGWKAIVAALLASDDLGPATVLTDRICDYLGARPRGIADAMANQPPKEFAKLASIVFTEAKSGDAVAVSILEEGVSYLDSMARKILTDNPGRLSLLGGLRSEITPWLAEDVKNTLSDPIHAPEDGAIHFAKTESANANKKAG
ncbi:ATPase [Arenicella chitinivorans]|uniref:ATPase n=2 Tax=Arenicella chitinivorans TaxID=1329800 RepID=A0A918VHX5_9GAMM|nr:ATPase [Arenicella chitinivorans]